MKTNIESYNILAKYYDKIYNFQKGNKTSEEINKFIDCIVSKVEKKNKFLDVGCGTGIYTNLIYTNFNKSIGIDPCKMMIEKCINPKIDFKCIFLNEIELEKYNMITSFSQIINHLSTIELLEEFIKDVSERLEDNGIFYFDIFNYEFFIKNKPLNESRHLSKKINI